MSFTNYSILPKIASSFYLLEKLTMKSKVLRNDVVLACIVYCFEICRPDCRNRYFISFSLFL